MRPDYQLQAFNAEVTTSSIIAPPPCPHSCPPVLVPSFGTTGRVALDGVLLFPSMTPVHRGHDSPRRCLTAALGLLYSSSDVFPSSAWALGLILKWVGVPRSFGPTIAPQNPVVRLLGRRWGFWCPRGTLLACQVLSYVGIRTFSFAYNTFLALQYPERVFIKFWRLCAPHIGRCNGNLTAGIPPAFMGTKNQAITLIGGINTHSNGPAILLLHPRALAYIPWIWPSVQSNLPHLSA